MECKITIRYYKTHPLYAEKHKVGASGFLFHFTLEIKVISCPLLQEKTIYSGHQHP